MALKYKEWMFRLSLTLNALALFGGSLIVASVLWHNRPLHSTTEWQGEARTHTGTPVSVKTYKALGREVFFLCVDGGDRHTLRSWINPLWFAMSFSQDGAGVTVLKEPRMENLFGWHLALERLGGMDIGLSELWGLSCTGNSVVFSNDVFFVSMSRKGLPCKR